MHSNRLNPATYTVLKMIGEKFAKSEVPPPPPPPPPLTCTRTPAPTFTLAPIGA